MESRIKLAFTLIELLVVIAIIGILSGLIVVTMSGVTQKATVAKSQVFSNSLRNALMLNLVSEWKFDEGTGSTTADSWSRVNNGTLIGATHLPVWKSGSDCIRGSCLQFDGTEDYINCGNDSSLNTTEAVTLEIWAKYVGNHSSSGDYDQFFMVREYGYRGAYLFGFYSNKPYLYASHDGSAWTWTLSQNKVYGSLGDMNWHHYVATINKDTGARLYVDGTVVDSSSTTGTIKSEPSATLYVGRRSPLFFQGYLDEARLYNFSVPSSQIKEQYYSGLNNLLINGNISKEEYLNRINDYTASY
jgi:prepilin-type N-terminal cleavage/methylation domain-containing protein